jgi:diguanylate cyclase (GGDEF)-like protein/PAS domain S-box-containing protein
MSKSAKSSNPAAVLSDRPKANEIAPDASGGATGRRSLPVPVAGTLFVLGATMLAGVISWFGAEGALPAVGTFLSAGIAVLLSVVIVSRLQRAYRERLEVAKAFDAQIDQRERASATTVMALREARHRFEQTFVGAPIGMALVNVHGSFLTVNRALSSTVGYTEEELCGRRVIEMTHPDDQAVIERLLDPAIENAPASDKAEIRFTCSDGRSVWLLASAAPVLDQDTQAGHFVVHLQDVTESKRASEELRDAHARLERSLADLERDHREISLINEMTHFLEAADSEDEITQVVARFGKQLFPDGRGVLYLLRDDRFDEVVHWGGASESGRTFGSAADSTAQRGDALISRASDTASRSANIEELSSADALRVPLVAQDKTIGLLSWEAAPVAETSGLGQRAEELAVVFAGHISLAVANLTLRQTLREESIRDVVTGLFNRRYMEESLTREMTRAERYGRPLSVIAIDIDHFKQFNDRHGHEAGDYVLRAVAGVLQKSIRHEDIACRSGGEEFLLILPEASLGIAVQRAEQLRIAIAALAVDYRDVLLDTVTISVGVSAFPEHGDAGDVVVRAADAALYRAKGLGRNQTVVAHRTEPFLLT